MFIAFFTTDNPDWVKAQNDKKLENSAFKFYEGGRWADDVDDNIGGV